MTKLEIPPLPKNTIMLVEVGSGAHGTGMVGVEDEDQIGIVVESAEDIVLHGERKSVMQRTVPEGVRSGFGDIDRTLHSLRKFLKLALSGNPSILMCLWSPIEKISPAGQELRDLGTLFVGRHVIPAFQGYMEAQVGRMLGVKSASGHGRRGGGQREEVIAEYGYDCYLDDTEFLTHEGWRTYDQILDGQEVATLNPSTDAIEWQLPIERVKKSYSGPIVYGPQAARWAVTPNHRMYVSPVQRGACGSQGTGYRPEVAQWKFVRANELSDRQLWHTRMTTANGFGNDPYDVTDEYLELVGCYVSDGCVSSHRSDGTPVGISIAQNVDGRLDDILVRLQQVYGMRRYHYPKMDRPLAVSWRLTNPEVSNMIVKECGEYSSTKHLPEWITKLSVPQSNTLLTALMCGDGTEHRCGGYVYYTTSPLLANDVQVLALAAGHRATVWGPYTNTTEYRTMQMYQVRINDYGSVAQMGGRMLMTEMVSDRHIVCFTVPNETLITRREGMIAMHGNTKYAMHAARLGIQCKELLATGRLEFPIPGASGDWLRAVRYGKVPFEDFFEAVLALDAELTELKNDESIPSGPQRETIMQWSLDTHLGLWRAS